MSAERLTRNDFVALAAMQMRRDHNERESVEVAGRLADELERTGNAPWKQPDGTFPVKEGAASVTDLRTGKTTPASC